MKTLFTRPFFISLVVALAAPLARGASNDDAPAHVSLSSTVFASNNDTLEVQGNGRNFTVAGNGNRIRISGESGTVNVAGNGNRVELTTVKAINLMGKDNEVTYEAGAGQTDPAVNQFGSNNRVTRNLTTTATTDATGNHETQSGVQPRVIQASGSNEVADITGGPVVCEGSHSNFILNGDADTLTVVGSNNNVRVGRVKRIVFDGSDNNVSYAAAPGADRPSVEGAERNNGVTATRE